MNYTMEIIEKNNFKTSNWSGGKTTELAIYPKEAVYKDLDFKWRLSSATVDVQHSTFTKLPNISRYICTLKGDLSIKHNDETAINLSPFQVHEFKGDWNTESFGLVTDFNLMIGNGCEGSLNSIDLSNTFILSSSSYDTSYHHVNECFFCPSNSFSISINEDKECIINKNTLVLITIPYPHKLNINLSSDTKTTILRSSMIIL